MEKNVEIYLHHCKVYSGLRPNTLSGKSEVLVRLLKFLDGKALNLELCRNYLSHLIEKGWKPRSVVADGKVIRTFVRWLFTEEKIPTDYSARITLPKIPHSEIEIVPFETAIKIIEMGTRRTPQDNKLSLKQKTEARECLTFALKSGLRNFELRALKAEDVNIENETMKVLSKGGSYKSIPIAKDQIEMLRKRVRRGGLVFCASEKLLQSSMARGCKVLGITQNIRVHTLRHIFGTELAKSKVSSSEARRLMRHEDTRIYDTTYLHLDTQDLSLALNGSRIVPMGLTPSERIMHILQVVQAETSGDDRFIVETKIDPDHSLSFNIRLR